MRLVWLAYIWIGPCLILGWLAYIWPGSYLILASALFTFESAGVDLARVLSTLGLVAFRVACVFFNFGQSIVYFWLGWPTCG